MPETIGTHWAVTSDAAEVYRRDMAAAKKLAEATDRLAKEIDNGSAAGKKQARQVLAAAEALKTERKVMEATVRIQKEWNVSTATAAKVARRFKGETAALSAEVKKEAIALDRAQRKTRELTRAQKAAAGQTQGLLVRVKGLQAGYAALAGAAGIGLLSRGLRAAIQDHVKLEAISRTLTKATGDEAAGMAFVRKEADRLGIRLESIGLAYAKLTAASAGTNLEGEGSRRIFSAVAQTLSELSIPAQKGESALRAIEQIMSKGKVQAEELRLQLGDAIPGIVPIMARALGVGTNELEKMLKAGEVMAEVALPLLADELARTFSLDLEARIDTTAAAIGRVETATVSLRGEIGELIAGGGGRGLANFFAGAASGAAEFLDEVDGGEAVLGRLFKELGQANAGVLKVQGGLLRDVAVAWKALVTGETIAGLREQVAWTEKLDGAIRKEVEALEAAESAFKKALQPAERWTEEQKESEKATDAMTEALRDSVEALKARDKVLEAGKRLTESLATEEERLADQLANARDLFDAGAISADTMGRALVNLAPPEAKAALEGIADAQERLNMALLESVMAQNQAPLPSAAGIQAVTVEPAPGFFTNIKELSKLQRKLVREQKELEKAQRQAGLEMLERMDAVVGGLDVVANLFSQIGGSIGNAISQLAGLASGIGSAIGNIQAGALQGGPLGALQQFQGVASILSQVMSFVEFLTDDSKKFGLPVSAQISGGRFSGEAIVGDSGGISQQQAAEAVNAWRRAINDFQVALGGFLLDLPEIAVAVRNDGEEFRLTVAGVFHGTFASMAEAWETGFRIALGTAVIDEAGANLQAALGRLGASSLEELTKFIPILQELDRFAEGLSATYSQALSAQLSWRTQLDLDAETLLRMGGIYADVIAWRDREIAKQKELLATAGSALAGVSSSLGRFQEWMDAVAAFNDAQAGDAARVERLGGVYDETAGSTERLGLGLKDVGDKAEGAGIAVGAGGGKIEGFGGAAKVAGEDADDARVATEGLSKAYVEMIRDAVRASAEANVLGEILAFQEKYGVELVSNEELRARIAELEFIGAKIRIQLLVREIELNAAALKLTQEQVDEYLRWADAIAATPFPGAAAGGGAGSGAGSGAGQARRSAAESFRESVARLRAELEGTSPQILAAADAQQKLREDARKGKIGTEEVAEALSLLAGVQLQDVARGFTESAALLRGTDLRAAFAETGQRAADALAFALSQELANPEAYAAARAAIEAGLEAELGAIGKDFLLGLGTTSFAIQQATRTAVRDLRFLVNHLDELGLTATQVARATRESLLPQLFAIAEQEAQRVGDEAALAKIQASRAQLEKVLMKLQLASIQAQLMAAGALNQETKDLLALARKLVDTPTPDPDDDDDRRRRIGGSSISFGSQRRVRDAAAADAAAGPGASGGTLADFIREMVRARATPAQLIEIQWAETMERIAKLSGTATERLEAHAEAEMRFAKLRMELGERQLSGLRSLQKEIAGDILRAKEPAARVRSARREFKEARAGFQVGDEASTRRLEDAIRGYRDVLQGYAGAIESRGGSADIVVEKANEAIDAALSKRLPPRGGVPVAGLTADVRPLSTLAPPLLQALPPQFSAGGPGGSGAGQQLAREMRDGLDGVRGEIQSLRTESADRWRQEAARRNLAAAADRVVVEGRSL